jgi:hypothetical protein
VRSCFRNVRNRVRTLRLCRIRLIDWRARLAADLVFAIAQKNKWAWRLIELSAFVKKPAILRRRGRVRQSQFSARNQPVIFHRHELRSAYPQARG